MPETAQGGAFGGALLGAIRVDLDHPAEAVGFVRLCLDVEARIVHVPTVIALDADAHEQVIGGFRRLAGIAAKGVVDIFLRRQHSAPGRFAAGAVGEGTQGQAALGIVARTHARMTGCRPCDIDLAVGGDAAVVGAICVHGPLAAGHRHFDDRVALRSNLDVGVGFAHIVDFAFGEAGKHHLVARGLVIDA